MEAARPLRPQCVGGPGLCLGVYREVNFTPSTPGPRFQAGGIPRQLCRDLGTGVIPCLRPSVSHGGEKTWSVKQRNRPQETVSLSGPCPWNDLAAGKRRKGQFKFGTISETWGLHNQLRDGDDRG